MGEPEYPFPQLACLPLSGDNCAIATRRIEAGTRVRLAERSLILDSTVLEGHRFAVSSIARGEPLLSWGLPFGAALRTISPGECVMNRQVLQEIRLQGLHVEFRQQPNFENLTTSFVLDETQFRPAPPVPHYPRQRLFQGYLRPGGRGVGTRNYIVILGVSSRTGSFARLLADRLKEATLGRENIDGIVAVAHTEGGSEFRPNNLDHVLRVLAGFMVHPNVGAVLSVDHGSEWSSNHRLRRFLEQRAYPLSHVLHRFFSLKGGLAKSLEEGEQIVRGWIEPVAGMRRTSQSLAALRVALQCGGSDAFSGISGNPLAAWVAREVLRYGGSANLAETDELIGAESYALEKVRDLATARDFLSAIHRFKRWAAWHGHSAEGNPSGGNKIRGLYNITLKSIGAALKKHPEVRLEAVIDYAEPMTGPGFYFMDSPGNDLESVAGQVASGSNLILFTTGNGSITNFPFVPTLKIMTTSRRYQLLAAEMDINAGEYLEGIPMHELGRRALDQAVDVASGALTRGELAGHSQVSIWRDWRQTGGTGPSGSESQQLSGRPLKVEAKEPVSALTIRAIPTEGGYAVDQVGLVLPTSLCAGQIARLAAARMNRKHLGRDQGLFRFVALVHTEGCGASGGNTEEVQARAMMGYLTHPHVRLALLLEHGCEKMHNAFYRRAIESRSLDVERFGFASVQLDGGIERVLEKVEGWFSERLQKERSRTCQEVGIGCLRLGLLSVGAVSQPEARGLAGLTRLIVSAGGVVILPEATDLLKSRTFLEEALDVDQIKPSLAYGQKAEAAGLYVMENPTRHWVEILTGMGACGVHLMVAGVKEHPLPSHPLIPLLQFAQNGPAIHSFAADLDLVLDRFTGGWEDRLLDLIVQTASRRYVPRLHGQGLTDFQLTRGRYGISM